MSEIYQLLIFNLIIIGVPLLLYFYPPKEINAIYGYRTKRSSKNINNWKFAQSYFSKHWIKVPIIVILSQVIMGLTMYTSNFDFPVIPIFSLAEFLIGSMICIYSTELALKRYEKSDS
ncbi:SdpI family protein [Psychroflexus tropicus]|uniref:SdpI family protein n=1 Tax=Psychroflexus tropicus TaxID=197345 RepID=UPI001B7FE330